MSLGPRIAELRKQRHWTQGQFAEKIGVHPQHITRLESDRARPSSTTLKRIAEVFEVRLDDLVDNKLPVPAALSQDQQLLEKIEQLQELDGEDRKVVFHIIDSLVTRKRMTRMLVGAKASH